MGQMRTQARRVTGRVAGLVAVMLVLAGLLAPAASAVDSPNLTLAKTSDAAGTLSVGDRFSYTLTATNAGTATAHKVVVQDNLPKGLEVRTVLPAFPGGSCTVTSSQLPPAPASWSVRCTRDVLEAGTSVAVSFEVEVTSDVRCGQLTNTADVSAKDEPVSSADDNEASATDPVACEPSIALETTAPAYAHVGASIPFTMKVRNDGQVALGSVDLRGPGCSAVRIGGSDASLSIDEVWTYRCARSVGAATPDPLTGIATVVAWTGAEERVSASDAATVRILDPRISITVTPNPISGSPGDTITYTYVVSNTGDAELSDISVDDDHLGHIGDIAQLQPGHDATLRASRILSASPVWVTNTATARGTDAGGHMVSDADEASVTIVSAGTGAHGGTAFTGLDATPAAALGALLGLLGAGLLVAARRRA
jgi:uncharacterized repeat protein (TIGR01451 family)